MKNSIIQRVTEVVDPTSVSNVIYEIMLDWRAYTERINDPNSKGHRSRLKYKRETMEVIIARFLSTDIISARRMLEEYFDVKVIGEGRPR